MKNFFTKQHSHLSRRDRMKRNPIPWILLIIISAVIAFTQVAPRYQTWENQKKDITKFKEDTPKTKELIEEKIKFLEEVTNEFEKEAAPYISKEKQRFPKKVDTSKIIKTLESFTISLDEASRSSSFKMDSVKFSRDTPNQKEKQTETNISISIEGSKANVKRFILYLQTSELPAILKKKTKRSSSQISINKTFIKSNLLPLMTIKSISNSEMEDGNFKTNIAGTLYSRL